MLLLLFFALALMPEKRRSSTSFWWKKESSFVLVQPTSLEFPSLPKPARKEGSSEKLRPYPQSSFIFSLSLSLCFSLLVCSYFFLQKNEKKKKKFSSTGKLTASSSCKQSEQEAQSGIPESLLAAGSCIYLTHGLLPVAMLQIATAAAEKPRNAAKMGKRAREREREWKKGYHDDDDDDGRSSCC